MSAGPRPRNPVVFGLAIALIAALLAANGIAGHAVDGFFSQLQSAISTRFGWLYVGSMSSFLVFMIWLAFSRFGGLRLGDDRSRPEFSRLSWFAMLFSAGMGIGLLFFSVAEPVLHFETAHANADQLAAARQAMGTTIFHWGLHPWAAYAVVGLALSYFGFRKNLPLSPRSAFFPLLGQRIYGRAGDLIDTLAVVSTLFGVATSLGLGAMQVNAGLTHVFGLASSTSTQTAIIAVITAIATASVVSGLKAGILRLSQANMGLALLLLLFVGLAGPTRFLVGALFENIGAYLQLLPSASFRTASYADPATKNWLANWTIFYWGWWIAWSPFVGMFIARISRGRTVREFIAGVLLAPTVIAIVWLTVFGDTALHQQVIEGRDLVAAVNSSLPTAIFVMLERFPFGGVAGAICTICVVLFFVTSSDSASLVVDTIASGGHLSPPVWQRIFWALLEGAVAIVLLWMGGLKALQTATITTALPFCIALILMCIALVRAMSQERSA